MSTGNVTAASGWSSSVGMNTSAASSDGAVGSASSAGGCGGGVAGGGLLAGGVPAGGVLAGGGVPAGGATLLRDTRPRAKRRARPRAPPISTNAYQTRASTVAGHVCTMLPHCRLRAIRNPTSSRPSKPEPRAATRRSVTVALRQLAPRTTCNCAALGAQRIVDTLRRLDQRRACRSPAPIRRRCRRDRRCRSRWRDRCRRAR